MKKIILALMLLSSFAFSLDYSQIDSMPSGQYVVSSSGGGWNNPIFHTLVKTFPSSSWISFNGSPNLYGHVSNCEFSSTKNYVWCHTWVEYTTASCPAGQVRSTNMTSCETPATEECPSNQEKINGQCVPKCDPIASQYRSPSGECQDCMSYSSFSGRSSCACDSQGTTYTPQSTMSTSENFGNYQYTRTNITCDNGLRISIYTDPVNTNPQDYNATLNPDGTVTPVDPTSPTTPPDNNNTVPTPTPTTNDIVEAIKASSDVAKEIKGSIGKVATNVEAMNAQLTKQGTTFEAVLAEIKKNGSENVKSNQLLGDVNTGLTQFKNKFGQWVDADQVNANNQLQATQGTTNAVNNASNAITSKLDEVISAIKENGDGNGTTPSDGNGTASSIDLNETNKKLDTLHDDLNQTNSLLNDIKGLFDVNGSKYQLSDFLPDNGWFETNKLSLDLNNYSGACYLETFSFNIAGESFQFPPPELVAKIPFTILSNLFMAFLFILGLKEFLRS